MSARSSARKKLVTKFRTSSSLIRLATSGGCVVKVGTGVGEGVTAAAVIGTGVEGPIGVTVDFSRGPFFFCTRYHPAPATITKAAIMIATRIALRGDGGIAGLEIDGFSG